MFSENEQATTDVYFGNYVLTLFSWLSAVSSDNARVLKQISWYPILQNKQETPGAFLLYIAHRVPCCGARHVSGYFL